MELLVKPTIRNLLSLAWFNDERGFQFKRKTGTEVHVVMLVPDTDVEMNIYVRLDSDLADKLFDEFMALPMDKVLAFTQTVITADPGKSLEHYEQAVSLCLTELRPILGKILTHYADKLKNFPNVMFEEFNDGKLDALALAEHPEITALVPLCFIQEVQDSWAVREIKHPSAIIKQVTEKYSISFCAPINLFSPADLSMIKLNDSDWPKVSQWLGDAVSMQMLRASQKALPQGISDQLGYDLTTVNKVLSYHRPLMSAYHLVSHKALTDPSVFEYDVKPAVDALVLAANRFARLLEMVTAVDQMFTLQSEQPFKLC
jgi:hypothetical protein